MKKVLLIVPGILVLLLLVFAGCKKTDTEQPCDNTGRICFTNKLDSIVTIQVVQMNNVFYLDKDFMECLTVAGDNPYTFKISSNAFYIDTTTMSLSCDDMHMILE